MATEVKLPKAFGKCVEVQLENGRTIRIEKWSVRKAASLTRRISKIVGDIFKLLDRSQAQQYEEALAKARDAGLKPGDDGFPEAGDYQGSSVSDLVEQVPNVIDSAIEDIVVIVSESLTTRDRAQEISADEVLDEFTFDNDLPEVLKAIIDMNFSGKSLGKWKSVMKAIGIG